MCDTVPSPTFRWRFVAWLLLEGGQMLVCLRAYLALSRADCCCHFVTAARGMQSSPHCGRFFKLIKLANNL